MSQWVDGEYLTPTNLNNKMASASSNTGFSTNTLRAESGATITTLAPSTALVAKSIDSGGAVWNAVAFGAVPSLAVDSTSAMQAALNAASAAGGGIVVLPHGDFLVSSLTLGRNVTFRGAGGRDLGGTPATIVYQTASTATTLIQLLDTGGGGVVIEDMTVSAFGNASNLGGVLIQNMANCQLRRVAISGFTNYGVLIQGDNRANYNVIDSCTIQTISNGTAVHASCNSTDGMDSSPHMINCFVNVTTPHWVSFGSEAAGQLVPDHPTLAFNRFVSNSSLTVLAGRATNAHIISNRFETVSGDMTINVTPPTGSQPFGFFIANDYAVTGTFTFTDSANTPSPRWFDFEANSLQRNWLNAGSAVLPAMAFASEKSLGLFRSGASSLALSYGSFRMPSDGEFIIDGGLIARIWESGGVMYHSVNRTKAFTQDNAGNASWIVAHNANAGSGDGIEWSHTSAAGTTITRLSLNSIGLLSTRSGALSFRTTTSNGSSSNMTNGEFALVNVSTTSAQLAYRSGNTTYIFNAIQASP